MRHGRSWWGPILAALLVPAGVHADGTRLRGAVASADADATEAAVALLRAGGNAVDAAVGAALVLAVTVPWAGNLGGGGFAVVRIGTETTSLDFREVAPAAATPDLYLRHPGTVSAPASLVGGLAVGVPGTLHGLEALWRRWGRLPWSEVVAPARRLAAEGFLVSERLARLLVRRRALLERFPETRAAWLPDGRPPRAGTRLRRPALAATLARYARSGATGVVAVLAPELERFLTRYGGILTAEDWRAYQPVWRTPIHLYAFGWEIATMGLPSSGGILVGETLGILGLRGYPGLQDPVARLQLLIEAWRRAYADRFRLGDPRSTEARPGDLLDPGWLARRAAEVTAAATPSTAVVPWGGPPGDEAGETTHLSVIDAEGNAVAITLTLNGAFGSGLWFPAGGFFLNNEMDDFTTRPGEPNLYGLVQGAANAVGPGKRMLSSMAPTIAWRGETVLALGSPGGSRIPTAVMQVLLGVIVDGRSLGEAVRRPRIHHQWYPDRVFAEPGAVGPATARALARLGYRVVATERPIGEVHAVLADGAGFYAVADPRGPGAAAVVSE